MTAYGPDLDEGLPIRSVLRTVVAAAALATQPALGSVTQPHNRDGNLGRRLIQRSRWHTAPDVTAGRTASRPRRASRAQCGIVSTLAPAWLVDDSLSFGWRSRKEMPCQLTAQGSAVGWLPAATRSRGRQHSPRLL